MANDYSPADGFMAGAPETSPAGANNFRSAMQSTVRAAAGWLIERQKPDGHWVARAESNACMEAQWCLALWFLGLEDHPLRRRLGNALLKTQRPDGAWQIYYGAPNGDINTTVEAYAALRSLGHRDDEPALAKALEWIASKGGLRNIRVFTRYWLALIGEWPWEKTPNAPPEVDLVPALVPVLDLQFRTMGARHADAHRRALGAPSEPASAARKPAGRAIPKWARGVRLRPAEEGWRGRMEQLLPRRRQGAARPAKCRAQARRGPVARRGYPANARMDRQASGRRRRLGRHPAAVDLQPDGAAQ